MKLRYRTTIAALLVFALFALPAHARTEQPDMTRDGAAHEGGTQESSIRYDEPQTMQEPDASKMQESSETQPIVKPLTTRQKREVEALYKELFATKKKLVAKYLEFGVITPEKARKWSEKLDMRYDKLEKNGFIPRWKKCSKDHKHHHHH